MRIIKPTVIILSLLFVASTACFGADVAKIGIVDFQKILTDSNAGKKAQEEINQKGRAMEAELKTKGEAVKKQQESFERESLVMDKKTRDQKENELRTIFNDFKMLQQKYMVDFKEQEKRIVSSIRDDILVLIEKLAQKEGFLMVFERREGGVLYFPQKMDITDTVIKQLNDKTGKTK